MSQYHFLSNEICSLSASFPCAADNVHLLAVVKRQPTEKIKQLLQQGHTHFAENKVQEAQRWHELRTSYANITLHHIGQLQTNKAREAVALYDVIETLDRVKLANALNKEAATLGKVQECYIQVNIGEEDQKGGMLPQDLERLLQHCEGLDHINVTGLMCIPPNEAPPAPFFALMQKLAARHTLPNLSMGMSADYANAIRFCATHVRLGTVLMGERV